MQIKCDVCGRAVDDALCQIVEEGKEILYVCPECFLERQAHPTDEQP